MQARPFTSGAHSGVPTPAESASPGYLLEMQILRPSPETESEILEVGPGTLCFNRHSGWFWGLLRFENHWPSVMALSYAKRRLIYLFLERKKAICICNIAHTVYILEWPLVSHFSAVYFTRQAKITSELLEYVKQIQMLYDAKYIRGNIKWRLRRCW